MSVTDLPLLGLVAMTTVATVIVVDHPTVELTTGTQTSLALHPAHYC